MIYEYARVSRKSRISSIPPVFCKSCECNSKICSLLRMIIWQVPHMLHGSSPEAVWIRKAHPHRRRVVLSLQKQTQQADIEVALVEDFEIQLAFLVCVLYNRSCVEKCICAPLAHLVEHLTLNQGVQGSSPWRRRNTKVAENLEK